MLEVFVSFSFFFLKKGEEEREEGGGKGAYGFHI
jgi:hypothetical protein